MGLNDLPAFPETGYDGFLRGLKAGAIDVTDLTKDETNSDNAVRKASFVDAAGNKMVVEEYHRYDTGAGYTYIDYEVYPEGQRPDVLQPVIFRR